MGKTVLSFLPLSLFLGLVPAFAADEASPPTLESGLESTVHFAARDSLVYDIDERNMKLWGKASVSNEDMTVEGPEIHIDYPTSSLHALPLAGASGELVELPSFSDRKESFDAEEIRYDFSTREGWTTNIESEDEDGYYRGAQVDRLASGALKVKDAYFTTCPKENPDFWFYSPNMTIYPKDRLVASPLIMYIRPVVFSRPLPPVPLIPMPYMVVSLKRDRSSGVLLPTPGWEGERGFTMSGLGYFWAMSDYADLRMEGDLSANDSWRLGSRFRYKQRYGFEGTIEGEFERYLREGADTPDENNWFIGMSHHQDFDPTTRLDVDVLYQGGERYYDIHSVNGATIINDQASSYASFSKTWDEGQKSLTVDYQANQDLKDDDLTQTLTTTWYQSRTYPFSASDGWLSKLSITPSGSVRVYDADIDDAEQRTYTGNLGLKAAYLQKFAPGYTANFSQGVYLEGQLDDQDLYGTRRGGKIELPFDIQSTLFRYLNLSANVTFDNYFVDGSQIKYYEDGSLVTTYTSSGEQFSTYGIGLEAKTRLYGTLRSGFLDNLFGMEAFRHTFVPTVTFDWNPDFRGEGYDYYATYMQDGAAVRYNRFGSAVYNVIPEEQRRVGLHLQNLFHAKFRGDNSGDGNVVQLMRFDASSSYNFAADSLQLAPLVLSASSNALSPNFLLSAGATYDFYSYDRETGEAIDTFSIDDGGPLLRFIKGFLNMSLSFQGNLRSAQPVAASYFKEGEEEDNRLASIATERFRKSSRPGSLLPWQLRTSLYLYSSKENPTEPATTSALLNSSARVSLNDIWQLGFTTGYDIREHEMVFPLIDLYGDFKCWEVGFEWVPSGEYQSYFFSIGIKSPHLKDLRFTQRGYLGGRS
ncbi:MULTISPECIES: putative LPS assembly protein LptD [Prosthecochloris]|uniref:LPS-assembly protein LptD n=1 Tax=Prosthecochloris vibrioformis TaxID=1098 RepID=A0A5C4RZ50_PROVB|nr:MULTISPECIES: putative LPS assembly protein LptD [Prosthecochloris]ANT65400.1 LPS assembly outer membrane complex protein LptD [Prosthecochloris sp. CIB 2401]TNJ35941.1 LPS-assembly protein LptD [Prosthecochloris vibrioformis]